jgi:predicted RNA binding protein YcfA (HicA-like mRNA interferase family)
MPQVETNRARILQRLEADGWIFVRHGADHDIYRHPGKPGAIHLPCHRTLSPGVARSIARAAGWT